MAVQEGRVEGHVSEEMSFELVTRDIHLGARIFAEFPVPAHYFNEFVRIIGSGCGILTE